MSPPKLGEPSLPVSHLHLKSPQPQPQSSLLLLLPGYMPGNGLAPGEYNKGVSIWERGLSPREGLVPSEALSLFLLQVWEGM